MHNATVCSGDDKVITEVISDILCRSHITAVTPRDTNIRSHSANAIRFWERERGDAMQRSRLLFGSIAARSLSGIRPLCSAAAEPPVQTVHSPQPPPARTLADLRRRLAEEAPALADFVYSVEVGTKKRPLPKPKWMKETIPGGAKYAAIKAKLRELKLHTVCEEARCPNLGECWSGGETGTATATIMILGDTCTRGCRSDSLRFISPCFLVIFSAFKIVLLVTRISVFSCQ
ncbi:hypothetical protein BHE74_00022035 [Ensete ventricosum]|nr:hypothetical protein BHE74_00022035 [Ensete ventricosum]